MVLKVIYETRLRESTIRQGLAEGFRIGAARFEHFMPEVIFNGPAGRIEGRYHHCKVSGAPIAIMEFMASQHSFIIAMS